MVIEDELKRQQQKIFFFYAYVQKLRIKLYYDTNKKCENEYQRNENELSVLMCEAKLSKVRATLSYLLTDFQKSMSYYVELCKQEKNG